MASPSYFTMLQKLVEINSFTSNKSGVDAVGKIFDEYMQKLGYESHIYKRELIGDHHYYTSSYNPDKKRLLLLGHLDTVFPPGKFESYKEDDKWVYGPGVCDMKGGNVVLYEALARVYMQKGALENIDVLLVSDEETGSDDSKFVTQELAKRYDYCFVYEAAGKNLELVTGRKGVGTFFLDIEGKAAHAGNHYSDGIDANLEASYKLQELVKLTNLERSTTVNVGKIEGGIGANTISPFAHLTFEIRYATLAEKERLLKEITRIKEHSYVTGSHALLRGGIQRDVMQSNEATQGLIKQIERITKEKILTEERGGVSDANIVSSAGVVTIDGFGPYGDGDHTLKERALKSSFSQRIALSEVLFSYFMAKGDFYG